MLARSANVEREAQLCFRIESVRLTHFDDVAGEASELAAAQFEVTSHGTLQKRSADESDSGEYTCTLRGTSVRVTTSVRVLRELEAAQVRVMICQHVSDASL